MYRNRETNQKLAMWFGAWAAALSKVPETNKIPKKGKLTNAGRNNFSALGILYEVAVKKGIAEFSNGYYQVKGSPSTRVNSGINSYFLSAIGYGNRNYFEVADDYSFEAIANEAGFKGLARVLRATAAMLRNPSHETAQKVADVTNKVLNINYLDARDILNEFETEEPEIRYVRKGC